MKLKQHVKLQDLIRLCLSKKVIGSLCQTLVVIFLGIFSDFQKCCAEKSQKFENTDGLLKRYVHSFREGHNFSGSIGPTFGAWKLNSFGDIKNETEEVRGLSLKFQYSFHMQIWKKWGYFLGSSLGYQLETSPGGFIHPVSSFQLPGLLGGTIVNLNPKNRISLGFESYLERVESIKESGSNSPKSLQATMLTLLDIMIAYDYFLNLKYGLRIEAHRAHVIYLPPDNAKAEGLIEGAELSKRYKWLGLGFVYHIL